MAPLDLRLYLVTDRGLSRGRSNLEVAVDAARGGVTVVQLRDKGAHFDDLCREARALMDALEPFDVPLAINDRADVARAVGAPILHIGQGDVPLPEARAMVGHGTAIGVSAGCVDDAVRAEREGADYIAVSPIWLTPTKPELTGEVGLPGLAEIRRAVSLPLVAIGGIKASNAAEVIAAGADGVAVVTALTMADDVEAAARTLRRTVDMALTSRGTGSERLIL